MKKAKFRNLLVAFVIIVFAAPAMALVIPGRLGKASPIVEPVAVSSARGMAVDLITFQDYDNGWFSQETLSATYNANGRCEVITEGGYNIVSGTIEPYYRLIFSLNANGKYSHADWQGNYTGQWITSAYSDWIYADDRLQMILTKEITPEGDIPYFLVRYAYDQQSGKLASIEEIYYMFDQQNPPKNKFEYTWDANGRQHGVQEYGLYDYDDGWVQGSFTQILYRADDTSSYADHLSYLEHYYPFVPEFAFGVNPFRVADKVTYSFGQTGEPVAGTTNHYIYDTSGRLDQIHTYLGTMDGILYRDTDFAWNGGLISSRTTRQMDYQSSEMLPDSRYLYSYTQVVDVDDPAVPAQVAAVAVNPNPFNPGTTISYSIQKADDVRVEVFNLKGQKVRVLVDGPQSPGLHNVAWDGTNASGMTLPSGIYLLRVRSGNHEAITKAILAK